MSDNARTFNQVELDEIISRRLNEQKLAHETQLESVKSELEAVRSEARRRTAQLEGRSATSVDTFLAEQSAAEAARETRKQQLSHFFGPNSSTKAANDLAKSDIGL